MWQKHRVAVIVPCYREARLIGRMLQRVPPFVDAIYVVDDASPDDTVATVRALDLPRVQLLHHPENRGVGAAIATGYRAALEAGDEFLVVMAGDDQMDPRDLPSLLEPLHRGDADYVKGNRFRHPEWRRMPRLRRLGSHTLSWLTRLTTGLDVDDTQCGYTALGANAARSLPLEELWPRFGYPNDLLALLAAAERRVCEVPVRPLYADEQSGLRPWHMLSIAWVVLRRFVHNRNLLAPARQGEVGWFGPSR